MFDSLEDKKRSGKNNKKNKINFKDPDHISTVVLSFPRAKANTHLSDLNVRKTVKQV